MDSAFISIAAMVTTRSVIKIIRMNVGDLPTFPGVQITLIKANLANLKARVHAQGFVVFSFECASAAMQRKLVNSIDFVFRMIASELLGNGKIVLPNKSSVNVVFVSFKLIHKSKFRSIFFQQ